MLCHNIPARSNQYIGVCWVNINSVIFYTTINILKSAVCIEMMRAKWGKVFKMYAIMWPRIFSNAFTLQRLMDIHLPGISPKICIVYIDSITVFQESTCISDYFQMRWREGQTLSHAISQLNSICFFCFLLCWYLHG